MVKPCPPPCKGAYGVAVYTFGRNVPQNVIGHIGRLVVVHVTIYAFNTQRLKMEQGCRLMAIHAIGRQVRPLKWETGLTVEISNILNNPRFWCVTPGAIHPYRLIMHICMTTKAVDFCISKNQCRMTRFAIDGVMLTCQWKFGGIVVKRIDLPVQGPTFGTVTNLAAYFKLAPVGRILGMARHNQKKQQNS